MTKQQKATLAGMYIYVMLSQYDEKDQRKDHVQQIKRRITAKHRKQALQDGQEFQKLLSTFNKSMQRSIELKKGTTIEVASICKAMFERFKPELKSHYGFTNSMFQRLYDNRISGNVLESVRVMNSFLEGIE